MQVGNSLKIFSLSLLFIFYLSFQFVGSLSPALSASDDNTSAKSQGSTANITIDTFTSDDSSKVVKYVANLRDANNNIIKTAYPDSNRVTFKDLPTPVENDKSTVPKDFTLYQNFPNPFNPETTIRYDLNKGSNVKMEIYDITGKLVKTLEDKFENAGTHDVKWDGYNNAGHRIAQGVYIYRIMTDQGVDVKKMVYLHGANHIASGGSSSSSNQNNIQSSNNSVNKTANMQYTVEIASTDSSNPKIVTKSIPVDLSADTAFSAYVDRKPVTITANVTTDNGATNVTGYNAILKDTLDNVIDQITATGSQAAFQNEPANKFYRMQIQNTSSTNPSIKDTVFQFKAVYDTLFNVNAEKYVPTRTISGLLTDDEGNVKEGYILAYNANGDSAVAMAGIDGKFSLVTKASNGDTLKAQIYNPSHAEGFIRKLYVAGKSDTNVTVDAVPLLADSSYIGPETLASFAWEANFGKGAEPYEGLKKADFDNLREIIASTSWVAGDTIKANEQDYIINIIGQDTVYNQRAIVQEGLSARIAPNEVGFSSPIGATQTALHINTGVKELQPADIWLVKIAENYAAKTSYYALLNVGNLKPTYDRLK